MVVRTKLDVAAFLRRLFSFTVKRYSQQHKQLTCMWERRNRLAHFPQYQTLALKGHIYEKWQHTEICALPPQIKINKFPFFSPTKLKRLLFLLNLKWTVQRNSVEAFLSFFFSESSTLPVVPVRTIPFTSATSLPVEPHTKGQTVNNKMPEIYFLTTINNFPGASFDRSDLCADKSWQQLT